MFLGVSGAQSLGQVSSSGYRPRLQACASPIGAHMKPQEYWGFSAVNVQGPPREMGTQGQCLAQCSVPAAQETPFQASALLALGCFPREEIILL